MVPRGEEVRRATVVSASTDRLAAADRMEICDPIGRRDHRRATETGDCRRPTKNGRFDRLLQSEDPIGQKFAIPPVCN